MRGWIDGLKRRAADGAKHLLLRQAAQALGEWLDRAGWTVEALDDALRAGRPVLDEAWQTIPPEALAQAAPMIKPLAAQLTREDYPLLLQELADNPAWAAYAQLLYYVHYPAFEAAMTQLRDRLLAL